MHEHPYRTYMVIGLLREGEGFPHESGYPLAHGIIGPPDMICFSAFFGDGFATCRRKGFVIRFPKIRINNSTLTICRRKRPPKGSGAFPAAITDMRADNLPRIRIDRESTLFSFPSLSALFFTESYFSSIWLRSHLSDTPTTRAMPACEILSERSLSVSSFFSPEIFPLAGFSTKCLRQSLHMYPGLP